MTEYKTDSTNLMKDKAEIARKFYDLARASFPDVGEPGAVWVLSEVLGWDMERIRTVSVDGFSKQSYRLFIISDSDGKRIVDPNTHQAVTVTRKWTSDEKSKLKDWWWLLGF